MTKFPAAATQQVMVDVMGITMRKTAGQRLKPEAIADFHRTTANLLHAAILSPEAATISVMCHRCARRQTDVRLNGVRVRRN